MLAKLTKYEFRATGRLLGIMYIALLIISVITRIELTLENASSGGMSMMMPTFVVMMLYVAIIAAIGVLTLIMIIQRFYKNLLQNEGYLMHTLPVKMWQHIASKLIVSMVWCIVSVIVVFTSLVIIGSFGIDFKELWEIFWNLQWTDQAVNGVVIMLEFIILMLVYAAAAVLQIYLAMAIGQLSGNHKLLCSFGAYIAINVVVQIIGGIINNIVSHFTDGGLVNSILVFGPFNTVSLASVHIALLICIIAALVKAVIFFAGTNYIMKNKLNLE